MFEKKLKIFEKALDKNNSFEYIMNKYHCIIPEYNKKISPKSFIEIFEKSDKLGLSACYVEWTQPEIDKFIILLNKTPVVYLEKILSIKPEIIKTNILEKIDAKDVSLNPEEFYNLSLQLQDELYDLYEIIKQENPKNIGHCIYLANLYCDLGFELNELTKIIFIIDKNILKLEYIKEIKDKDTLVKLLNIISTNNIDKCVEMLNFMKDNEIRQIQPKFFSMIFNHTNKDELSKKIKEKSIKDYITIKGTDNYTEWEFCHIQNDYLEFTPFDELIGINIDGGLLKRKIVMDLLKNPYETIYSFYTSFKDIQEIAKKYDDNEMLLVMDMLNSFNNISPFPKEYKKIYDKYKNKINIDGTQLLRKFKEYYCHKLNDGLFDPKELSDKEGEYENYKIEYIEYNGKKIKKIVLWDPNFYMDVSNIVSWKDNNIKDPKIRELSQEVIKHPEIFGSIIDGSNTNCTTLINPMQMRTFGAPVVTGGYRYIDPEKIILANNTDAGTKDSVPENALGTFWSKDSLLSKNSGEFDNVGYNEVTFFKSYYKNGHGIKKHVFDYMMLNLGFKKQLSYEDTLHWASIYNIPVVEIDCQKLYEYYENELKKFIIKCHDSKTILTTNDCIKIIDLIRVLRTFGEVDNYILLFKKSFEYALNWDVKKNLITLDNNNELQLIIEYLKTKIEFNNDEWLKELELAFNNVELKEKNHKSK